MKREVLLMCLVLVPLVYTLDVEARSSSREGRKLFGGYRITPRFCKPTRETSSELKGPNICMFNHECIQRSGIVVGACMDGFLFGACCQVPLDSAGELIESEQQTTPHISDNTILYTKSPQLSGEITSSGLSQITSTLLNTGAIPTAQEDAIVQLIEQGEFNTGGVTHPTAPDTIVVNQGSNDINPEEFQPVAEDRQTTLYFEETTRPYVPDISPLIQISISSAAPYYTQTPGFQKPIFRPKPQKPSNADKYILVPTINHASKNKTSEIDSIVNIIQMLNDSSTSTYSAGTNSYTVPTTRKPPSTSYVFSATTTHRPGYDPSKITTKSPPSTYYTTTTSRRTTTKNKTTSKKPTTKPTKSSSKKPTTRKPSVQYVSSSTFRPAQVNYITTQNSYQTTSKKPPSTSYVYSSTITKRPTPSGVTYTSSTPHPTHPTVIVLGPLPPNRQQTSPKPTTYSATNSPTKRPVTVTINNHITQNIYSTSERPSPTVLITPKPSASTPLRPTTSFDVEAVEVEVGTSADDLINFPPVRNPNLNMSNPIFDENDITTPDFLEDDLLNTKVESFVNKIIAGLQEPFHGLKDIVYNKNKTAFLDTTTKKPVKKQGTTKKPTAKPSGSNKPTTRRPTTPKRPSSTATTRKPTSTTKRSKPTKRITTTTQSFIETNDETTELNSQDYRSQCGIRPLIKSGRIVGGKGANFGEFPWQVLVRESTWLGLFTKNKCGGVLISNRYVMTAAHCQPGFLASLVAVFGEFDISGDLETKRSISRNVKRVIVHRQYDASTFENDLALLELEHPIQFDAHIVPICLPRDHEDFTGRMATVTGWGRLKYGGGVPSVLQEVQVPIMENAVCQEMFRTAGHSKVILESFLCAGYANGQKDSCEGDSGGPLVLQRPDGRYQLAGTVSHGIKCAAPYLPGVYMRTTYYKPWIESITAVN